MPRKLIEIVTFMNLASVQGKQIHQISSQPLGAKNVPFVVYDAFVLSVRSKVNASYPICTYVNLINKIPNIRSDLNSINPFIMSEFNARDPPCQS